MMGYLSCKASSSISTTQNPNPKTEKPVKIQHFDYADLEAATDGFSEQKLLGKGSHGSVYKAVLRGRSVAVKKPAKGQEMSVEADNEMDILSKINSPRLVNLLGFTDNSRDRLLVVEFMCNGTLYDVLHSNSATGSSFSSSSSSSSSSGSSFKPLSWGRRIRLAMQVAKAVDILHSQVPQIIHRDIKSANVLIDKSFNARLGDFGLALRCGVDNYRLRSTPPAGTMGYLDPNYITPDNLSTKTDVFSFGILLLEILSGRKAIDISHSPPSIVDWAIPLIKKGKIVSIFDPQIAPPKDPTVRKHLAVIAAKCVRSCRERRPSMKEVVDWLIGLTKFVPINSWNGFNNPCMMVETIGRPVEFRRSHESSKGEDLDSATRRVFSDLGFRSNLMELMAFPDEEGGDDSDELNLRSSSRVSSSRFSRRGKEESQSRGNDKGSFRMSSVGEGNVDQ